MAGGPAAAQTGGTAKATQEQKKLNCVSNLKKNKKNPNYLNSIICADLEGRTHTTTGGDCNLDRVPPRLADVLQVQRFVGGLVVAPLDGEGRGVDADLDRGGPVCVHLSVFVVVALKLQLKV